MAGNLQQILATLNDMDEDVVTKMIGEVLQNRPEVAPAVLEFAVPDLTYAPSRALTDRRCSGVLKAVDEDTGYASINCPEMQAVFGGDVLVHWQQIGLKMEDGEEVPRLDEGARISFAVTLTKESEPQAFDLLPLGGDIAPSGVPGMSPPDMGSMMAAMGGGGMPGGMGGGMPGGMGGAMPGGMDPPAVNPMSAMMAAMGGGGMPAMNPMSAMMAAMGGGGGMPLGMGMGNGVPGGGGDEPCRFFAKAGWCKFGEQCHWAHIGTPNPNGGPGKGEGKDKGFDPNQLILGEYMGVIKSFNPEKGFGFIACDLLKDDHKGDVFLGSKHVGDFGVGSEVKFTAYLYQGRLQCKDLSDAAGQVPPQQGCKHLGQQAGGGGGSVVQEELGNFVGMIKTYNVEKGFGFLESQGMKDKGYEMDAFLPREAIGNFTTGSVVSFSAYLKDSKLRARDLKDASGGMNMGGCPPPMMPPMLVPPPVDMSMDMGLQSMSKGGCKDGGKDGGKGGKGGGKDGGEKGGCNMDMMMAMMKGKIGKGGDGGAGMGGGEDDSPSKRLKMMEMPGTMPGL